MEVWVLYLYPSIHLGSMPSTSPVAWSKEMLETGEKATPLGGSSGDLWDFLGRKQQNLWRFYGNLMEYTHTCVCIYIYTYTVMHI